MTALAPVWITETLQPYKLVDVIAKEAGAGDQATGRFEMDGVEVTQKGLLVMCDNTRTVAKVTVPGAGRFGYNLLLPADLTVPGPGRFNINGEFALNGATEITAINFTPVVAAVPELA